METMLFYINLAVHELFRKKTAVWVEHQLFIIIIIILKKYLIHASYIESLKLSDFMLQLGYFLL